ncbi:PAS domain S-box-containing protein [Krasilnikovia cinnamomea]|uniref:Sensor-like histidine kinase SenX3 n=1 Tax=Krasilnikovia cinnamomea TaxID=349313 RepID=A0A4Q7ZHY7_9ACTN|nr:PAS domain-containing sensor histidine kinase [Krasilnikovia cinnamomea]RZU50437.1 PAS domain S-box-containing protein [Krasilnikovia cinnamomea]
MRIAAQDVGRLSRVLSGCAGATVAASALIVLLSLDRSAAWELVAVPAAALVTGGLALLLHVLPGAGPALRATARALGAVTAAIGLASLARYPAAGIAAFLIGLALVGIDVRIRLRPGAAARFRVADALLGAAAIVALVALVPRMFAPSFPPGRAPVGVMSTYVASALLILAAGAILARPEAGPLRTAAPAGPGTTVRHVLPLLVAVPVVAAVVSALAGRAGVSRPVAAISTGVILTALVLLALAGRLVRSLDAADRRQRDLVAQLRDRGEYADTLLQSINEAVMVLDANYRVLDVNRRWHELSGRPPEDELGRRPDGLPPVRSGEWIGEMRVRRPDGADVPVLATMAPIPDAEGQPRGYVATYVDIAERKRAEQALTERAGELERSNVGLREANTRLEEALAFKNDLTSMLTHDVAQPISSIASLAELLAADWAELPEDIRLELATKIDKNTRRLIKMMNDLQLLFRLDTGTVTARRTPVPLREVAETVAADTAPDAEIDIEDELAALADRGHLEAVLQHLLSNAVAYGDAPVQVRAWRLGEGVELMVQDRGPGIPEELVPRLFDRFARGSGLGLFIVRHLVEANGGSVRYERAEPRGARMVLALEEAAVRG